MKRCGKQYGKNRRVVCVLEAGHNGNHSTRLRLFQLLPGEWVRR